MGGEPTTHRTRTNFSVTNAAVRDYLSCTATDVVRLLRSLSSWRLPRRIRTPPSPDGIQIIGIDYQRRTAAQHIAQLPVTMPPASPAVWRPRLRCQV